MPLPIIQLTSEPPFRKVSPGPSQESGYVYGKIKKVCVILCILHFILFFLMMGMNSAWIVADIGRKRGWGIWQYLSSPGPSITVKQTAEIYEMK